MVLTFVLLIWGSFSSFYFFASIGKHSLRITCPVLLSFASSREALSIWNVDDEIVFYWKQEKHEIKVQSGSGYLGPA